MTSVSSGKQTYIKARDTARARGVEFDHEEHISAVLAVGKFLQYTIGVIPKPPPE